MQKTAIGSLSPHAVRDRHVNRLPAQMMRVMRLLTFFLFVASLSASASGAAQSVTISGKELTYEQIFTAIEKQTGYVALYDQELFSKNKTVSIAVAKQPLYEFLDMILKDQPLEYEIEDKTIFISRKSVVVSFNQREITINRPANPITGIILSPEGEPLADASIRIKGSAKGVSSNANGQFTIEANLGQVLVVSYTGYQEKEIIITPSVAASSDREPVTITLTLSETVLEDVIIKAGYYNVKKREATGNIVKVSADVIEDQPVGNPLAALQGRVAGVYIQPNTGVPGGSFTVQIRGRNSLRTDANYPLYIIDDVPFVPTPQGSLFSNAVIIGGSPFNNLNPSDIESIEILKDADATAIYGSRGANGVVLITTKKGASGKSRLNLNIYSGISKIPKKMDLLNTSQYIAMRKEAFANDGIEPSTADANDLLLWDTTRYTDWQDVLIGGTANVTNIQASLAGGSSSTKYMLSAGYFHESTVFPGDFKDDKFSFHNNIIHESLNKKFGVDFGSNIIYDRNRLLYQDPTGKAVSLPPNAPEIFDGNGSLNWENGFQNPYASLLEQYKLNTTNIISNLRLTYNVLPSLSIKANIGYNTLFLTENVLYPMSSYNPAFGLSSGSSTFTDNNVNTWIAEPQAQYLWHHHKSQLTILAGATFQQTAQNGKTVYATGFASDALLENLQAASMNFVFSSNATQYRYNALFARLNYLLNEKYIVNLTGRRDGSSRFGPNKRFASFGAAGFAWIFSREKFMQSLSFISFTKLRASIGTTGNDQIGDYQHLETFTPAMYSYDGIPGLYPTRLANADYSWEKNTKLEGALNISFFKDRLSMSVSVYKNRSSNQLVGYSLSAVTGFNSIQYNLPAVVRNTGVEIEVSSVNIKRSDFEWTTSFNFTAPKNKLLSYPDISNSSYSNTYVVGKSLFVQNRFHYTGINPETGDYQFQDISGNGTGTYFPGDLQPLTQLTQEYFGGLNNHLFYKRFQLDFFIQFVRQTGLGYFAGFGPPGTISNQPIRVLNRWQHPGSVAQVQRYTTGASTAANVYYLIPGYGDNNIVDASFVRLKNASISYEWELKKISTSKLRLFLLGQNLFTITPYEGLDPEMQSVYTLPALRTITAGVQLTF